MDEILASIRRMISEGDMRAAEPGAAEVPGGEKSRSGSNVARLFADDDKEAGAASEAGRSHNVVELAIEQAMEDAEAEARAEPSIPVLSLSLDPSEAEPPPPASQPVEEDISPPHAAATAAAPPLAPPDVSAGARGAGPLSQARPASGGDRRAGQALLSPHADAVVSGAFNQLASTMLSGSTRTIDELVEDLLRPMLQGWLDINLPPLVERMVREEIERVSRGRR